jgi:L-threonylcarbamoyladenylate synthase
MLLKHYAPETPVRLNAIDVKEGEALLAFGSDKFMVARDFPEERKRNLSEGQDLYEAAANLFAMLKELDGCGAKAIAVMAIPESGIGVAINDRLRRAAQQ